MRRALRRARGDRARSVATLLAILMAVTSFVVLTGHASTQRLEVTQTAEENYRASYDILVRPQGSTLGLEANEGLVRTNFLSGQYGGITLEQVDQVMAIPGVEIAAPIAMVGYYYQKLPITHQVASMLPRGDRGLIRYRTEITARNGTAGTTGPSGYYYRTATEWEPAPTSWTGEDWPDMHLEMLGGEELNPCAGMMAATSRAFMGESIHDGFEPLSPLDPEVLWEFQCHSDVPFRDEQGHLYDGPHFPVPLRLRIGYPMLVAAIDPAAEAALVGLDEAVFEGRYLTAEDTDEPAARSEEGIGRPWRTPALLAGVQEVDYQVRLIIEELDESVALEIGRTGERTANREIVQSAAATQTLFDQTYEAADLYAEKFAAQDVGSFLDDVVFDANDYVAGIDAMDSRAVTSALWRPGDVTYTGAHPLQAQTREVPPRVWRAPYISSNWGNELVPLTVGDTSYREITAYTQGRKSGGNEEGSEIGFDIVGKYDPEQLTEFSELSELPLETYWSAQVVGGDEAARAALGNTQMLSDLNIGGYLQQAPAILIPMNALDIVGAGSFIDMPDEAPVSAIRVRVADVAGMDERSREQIRQVAEQIHELTGLDVDVTIGSSPTEQHVALPATDYGSPELLLAEPWAKKGTAVAVVEAIDAKSAILFLLILLSSALTVAVSAAAAVQTRRQELGILSAVGWRPRTTAASLLVELALLGLAAGVLGAALAWPLTRAFAVAFDPARALLAVPVALTLAVLAGLLPAWRAARLTPLDAMRPPVVSARRRWLPFQGAISLGIIAALRRPGRLLTAALALALGTGALVFLLEIVRAFSGRMTGTLLGDYIALQVRTPDLVAALLLALLGLAAVAFVLFLAVREDARSFAVLQAQGWTQARLRIVVLVHALLIALVGLALGVLAGLGALHWLGEGLPDGVGRTVAGVSAGGAFATLIVAWLPAELLRRLPTARILAQD